jgi:hypothetical protein
MNDLDRLKDVGRWLDGADDVLPASVRIRVMQHTHLAPALTARTDAGYQGVWRGRRLPMRSISAAAILIVCLAAAAVAGLVAREPEQRASPGDRSEATTVLHNAALAAYASNLFSPAAGDVIFTETVGQYQLRVQQPDGSFKARDRGPVVQQVWIPVDTAAPGMMRTRPNGQADGWSEPLTIHPTSRVVPDMPEAPNDVIVWLRSAVRASSDNQAFPQQSPGQSHDPQDDLVFQRAADLLISGTFLTSRQQGSLLGALSVLPGLTVTRNVRDLAGRSGVGVGVPGGVMLVFDVASSAFLGTTKSSLLRQALVQRIGQEP